MECYAVLVVVIAGGCLIGLLVLLAVTVQRSRANVRRIADLEGKVDFLRTLNSGLAARVTALEKGEGPRTAEAAAAATVGAVEAVGAGATSPASSGLATEPTTPAPSPAHIPATVLPAVAAAPPVAGSTAAPAPLRAPTSPETPAPPAAPPPTPGAPSESLAPVPAPSPAAGGALPSGTASGGAQAPAGPEGVRAPAVPGRPAPPAAPPPADEAPPAPAFDLERWVGVRGAAVLGSIVLALAGFLFLKYSIEHGLIPPAVRVAIGVAVGLGAILGAEALRRRDYAVTADALSGAGIVLLYASFWACHVLYRLTGAGTTFVLMVLVTAAAGVLSWRHRSLTIAVLGLAGGFATPFLLSTGADRPIALFGYLLLLNAGLLTLARRRGWPVLGIAGIAATAFYEAAWIAAKMGPHRVPLGLAILAVFALLYAIAAARDEEPSGEAATATGWTANQAVAVLLPFLFAFYLARSGELAPHLFPTAALLLLLSAAALWIARARALEEAQWLPLAAAAGDLAVVAVWCFRSPLDRSRSWEAVAVSLALAFVFHVGAELELRRIAPPEEPPPADPPPADPPPGDDEDLTPEASPRPGGAAMAGAASVAEPGRRPAAPALLAACGFLVLLSFLPVHAAGPSPWPWLTGLGVLAALLVRDAELPERENLQAIAAAGLSLGLSEWFLVHGRGADAPPPALSFGLLAAVAVAFQILALRRRERRLATAAEAGAALLPAGFLLALLVDAARPTLDPGWFLPATVVFAFLSALALTRLRSGGGYLGVMVLLAGVHWAWTGARGRFGAADLPGYELTALAVLAASAVLFTAWPFAAAGRFRASRPAWLAAALAGPLWFCRCKSLYLARFGDGAIGLLPVALGALALPPLRRARRVWRAGDPLRTEVLAGSRRRARLRHRRHPAAAGHASGSPSAGRWRGSRCCAVARLDHPGLK